MKRKLVSVFFLMTLCSTSARAALTNEEMDCLFNWAERSYTQLLVPAAVPSQTLGPYYFRHYVSTQNFLGVNTSNQHVVYLAPSMGAPADLGEATPFVTAAGCTATTVLPPSSTNYAGTWTWSYGTGSAFSVQFVVTQDGDNLTARIPLTGQYFVGKLNGTTAVFTEADSMATAQATVTLVSNNAADLKMDSCAPALMCMVPAGSVIRLTR